METTIDSVPPWVHERSLAMLECAQADAGVPVADIVYDSVLAGPQDDPTVASIRALWFAPVRGTEVRVRVIRDNGDRLRVEVEVRGQPELRVIARQVDHGGELSVASTAVAGGGVTATLLLASGALTSVRVEDPSGSSAHLRTAWVVL